MRRALIPFMMVALGCGREEPRPFKTVPTSEQAKPVIEVPKPVIEAPKPAPRNPSPKVTPKSELPSDKDMVAGLRRIDKEAMHAFREGKQREGFIKMMEAWQACQKINLDECAPEEALIVAVAYVRVSALVANSVSEEVAVKIAIAAGAFSKKGGVKSEDYLAWYESLVKETVAAYKNEPVTPKKLTFAEAYAAAEKLADKLDADEPAKTAKAMKLLTGLEMLQVGPWLGDSGELLDFPEASSSLRRAGLLEHLRKLSRAAARRSTGFKTVAAKLWKPESGPEAFITMMEEWGQVETIWRTHIITAIEHDTPTPALHPEARDGLLRLGGKAWLER